MPPKEPTFLSPGLPGVLLAITPALQVWAHCLYLEQEDLTRHRDFFRWTPPGTGDGFGYCRPFPTHVPAPVHLAETPWCLHPGAGDLLEKGCGPTLPHGPSGIPLCPSWGWGGCPVGGTSSLAAWGRAGSRRCRVSATAWP